VREEVLPAAQINLTVAGAVHRRRAAKIDASPINYGHVPLYSSLGLLAAVFISGTSC
jgi:hypothetical protein